MKQSVEKILTTHVGSLPRPADLLQMNDARANGRDIDIATWAAHVKSAITEVVRLQREAGIDVANDGELSKSSWSSYVNDRLGGFAESVSRGQGSLARGRDRKVFQEFYDEYDRIQPFRTVNGSRWTDVVCNAAVTYTGQSAVRMDIDNLKAACGSAEVEEAFITAVAPGSIVTRRLNRFYPNEEAFLFAIAEAMKTEYKAIVDAGFLLQIDDPQLVTRYDAEDPPPDTEQYRKGAAVRVEALNYALAEIPPERIRYHICWGGWHGPHTTDLPLKDIVGLLLQIHAGAYLIEAANARHEHAVRLSDLTKLLFHLSFELVNIEVARVNNFVGQSADRFERPSFARNTILYGILASEWMRPACFAEATEQNLIGGIKKQHLNAVTGAAQFGEHRRKRLEKLAPA